MDKKNVFGSTAGAVSFGQPSIDTKPKSGIASSRDHLRG
jgi:hypothetical protein